MNYDWKLLRKQKEMLMRITCDDDYAVLEGVIHMIDDIQDRAVANGDATEAEVFGKTKGEVK
jgi:hypothetical protein